MAHLPRIPSYVEGHVLLVVLTRLSETEQSNLTEKILEVEPSLKVVYAFCPDNEPQRRVEEQHEDGQSSLHQASLYSN